MLSPILRMQQQSSQQTQPQSIYVHVYERHDALRRKRAAEQAISSTMEKRKSTLQSRLEEMTELPALSSFLHIKDACSTAISGRASGTSAPGVGDMEDSEDEANSSGNNNGDPKKRDGFDRMNLCRLALEALDNGGWKRSYHQRLFHEAYIAACARPFWKLDPPGSFARAHQRILEINNWDNLSQEILISTPRRYESLSILCSMQVSIILLLQRQIPRILNILNGYPCLQTLLGMV